MGRRDGIIVEVNCARNAAFVRLGSVQKIDFSVHPCTGHYLLSRASAYQCVSQATAMPMCVGTCIFCVNHRIAWIKSSHLLRAVRMSGHNLLVHDARAEMHMQKHTRQTIVHAMRAIARECDHVSNNNCDET